MRSMAMQRRRCTRGEVAMACKSGGQGDCREVTAALKNVIERVGEAFLQDVVVDGRAFGERHGTNGRVTGSQPSTALRGSNRRLAPAPRLPSRAQWRASDGLA